MRHEEFCNLFESERETECNFGYQIVASKNVTERKEKYVEGVDYIVTPCVFSDLHFYRNEIVFTVNIHIGNLPDGFEPDLDEYDDIGDGAFSLENNDIVNMTTYQSMDKGVVDGFFDYLD